MSEQEQENYGEWSIFSASLIGPSSKKKDKPNQDYFSHTTIIDSENNAFTVLAVADGAGSLELSHVGAELAVETVLETLYDYLSQNHASIENAAHIATYEARKTLLEHPDKGSLGCTLVFAILDHSGQEYVISLTGDAFAVIEAQDTYHLIQNPAAGEYANITKLITSKNTDTTFTTGTMEEMKSIALNSDGLAHTTIDNSTQTPTVGFWNTIFSKARMSELNLEELFDYMKSLDKIDDDTTMVVAVR